jgi:hypothetical protein
MGVFLYMLHKPIIIFEVVSQFSVIRASCRKAIVVPGFFSHLSSVSFILECAVRHGISECSAQKLQHRRVSWLCCKIASFGMNNFTLLKIRGMFLYHIYSKYGT